MPVTNLIWWCYIDERFMIWTCSLEDLDAFITYLNDIHPTINFRCNLSFRSILSLDVNVSIISGQLITAWSLHKTDPKQYGFMPGRKTIDCLVDRVEEISTTLDRGDYAVTIVLDLSKHFYWINSILLSKLSYYGINPITWFRSNLHNRKQRVFENGIFSDTLQIVIHFTNNWSSERPFSRLHIKNVFPMARKSMFPCSRL